MHERTRRTGELIGEFLAELAAVVVFAGTAAAAIAAYDRFPIATGIALTIVVGFAIYGGVTVVRHVRSGDTARKPPTTPQRIGIGALIAVGIWLSYALLY